MTEFEEYQQTGMLGGYMPERVRMRKIDDGKVIPFYPDGVGLEVESGTIGIIREVYIGGCLIRFGFRLEVRVSLLGCGQHAVVGDEHFLCSRQTVVGLTRSIDARLTFRSIFYRTDGADLADDDVRGSLVGGSLFLELVQSSLGGSECREVGHERFLVRRQGVVSRTGIEDSGFA